MLTKVYFPSKLARSLLSEFVGSGMLLMTIVLASCYLPENLHVALAIAAQVVGYTYVGGGMNNCAILTGVTLVRIRRGEHAKKTAVVSSALRQWLLFALVEHIGAFVGVFIGYGLLGNDATRNRFPVPQPSDGLDNKIPRAMLAEFVFTFQLVYVMLFTCVAKEFDRVNVNRFLGPSLGCVIFVAVSVAGPISGAALNPIVATSLQLVQCMVGVSKSTSRCNPLSFLWMYWLMHLCAGFCAGICFLLASNEADPSEYDDVMDEEEVTAPCDADATIISTEFQAHANATPTERTSLVGRARTSTEHRRRTRASQGGMKTLADLE